MPSVMAVDDQVGVRRLLYEVLKEEYEVILAASGPEAIEKVMAQKPQLVLMDLKMPGMSGMQALREMRRLGYDGPAIMMTAYDELDLVDQAKRLGVQHYLVKPFAVDDLKRIVSEQVGTACSKPSEMIH
ncbi:MAG: response regulator [Clostridia bacterium]|nr:MAG: response regulator [Clostridia bacterium]